MKAKEKELQELQKQEDIAVDPDIKGAFSYMISVAVDALGLRVLREEVPDLRKFVLLERRRTAIEPGCVHPTKPKLSTAYGVPCHIQKSFNPMTNTTCLLCLRQCV